MSRKSEVLDALAGFETRYQEYQDEKARKGEMEDNKTFTVWTIEAPPEPTVKVNRIVDLTMHISDLAMCYLEPGERITITASEMTQEQWDALPEFEGAPNVY